MNLLRPSPSAHDIQNHLYASFLDGSAADVALRVRGSWHAVYNLHRVVLIQSGFFHSLFTGGFSESSRIGYHDDGPQEIVIHFDDPNITRAAFEICISSLYGGGPPLHISPSLISSSSQPLTPDFPVQKEPLPVPDKHHPATPRFLLSLLATSVYLSIPSLASQALSSILITIGPFTVVKYLNFALGKFIGSLDSEIGEPEAAVGLEHVARVIDDERSTISTTSTVLQNEKDGVFRQFFGPTETRSSSAVTSLHNISDCDSDQGTAEPSSHYGAISDKIGEACACWLARWGTDLLPYEIQRDEGNARKDSTSPLIASQRARTIPLDSPRDKLISLAGSETPHTMPCIWACGGLSAVWVAAIVSADAFFVKGERERYAFARSAVELRRKDGIIEAEEEVWATMFEQGIYYANMTTEDIIEISQDISPTTKKPFVSLSTLQVAHWNQSVLRQIITVRSSITTPTVTQCATRDKELGVTLTTADILSDIMNKPEDEKLKIYYLVPGNSSVRIGESDQDTAESSPLTMEQLFMSVYSMSRSSPPSPIVAPPGAVPASKPPTSEGDFFGLRPSKYTAACCVQFDPTSKCRWSPNPPYRFGVEFWDIDSLKEKSRLHSHTICYAGSLFNIYVQLVRKKNQVQLGIYLLRQSSIEPIPPASAPSSLTLKHSTDSSSGKVSSGSNRGSHHRNPSLPSAFAPSTPPTTSHFSPSIYPSSRSTTPVTNTHTNTPTSPSLYPSLPGSPSPASLASSTALTANTLPATAAPVTPLQPYRDPRPSISAYFAISCASATGSSLTRFTSSPDVFPVGQSWGWKSSSLRTEEYINDASDSSGPIPGKEVSMRVTVVLGLV